jgi:hypothetical protein
MSQDKKVRSGIHRKRFVINESIKKNINLNYTLHKINLNYTIL